jgi:hypothetical protein
MHQYLPFPLSHDLSPNHSVTPAVGQNDILAYSGYKPIKLLHILTLQPAIKMGEIIFARGGVISARDICTDIQETCLGALFLQQPKGIQRYYKFEILNKTSIWTGLQQMVYSNSTAKHYSHCLW